MMSFKSILGITFANIHDLFFEHGDTFSRTLL